MRPLVIRLRQAAVVLFVLAAPRAALACPVCFGQNDSPMASAINAGVIMMLGVVVAVLGSFAAFIVYLIRRGRLLDEPSETAGPARRSRFGVGSNPQEGIAQC